MILRLQKDNNCKTKEIEELVLKLAEMGEVKPIRTQLGAMQTDLQVGGSKLCSVVCFDVHLAVHAVSQ